MAEVVATLLVLLVQPVQLVPGPSLPGWPLVPELQQHLLPPVFLSL